MAREVEGGSRLRTGRSSASLDPNRSTVRRSSPRRNTIARPVPPRVSKAPPAGPRNSRLAPPPPPKGPPLSARLWPLLVALSERVSAVVAARGQQLASLKIPQPSRWLGTALVVLASLAGALGVAHFVKRHLTTAPAFAIDALDVKGLVRVDRDELLSMGGLKLGTNIFAQRPEDVQARLVRHPWIVSASVERELPSKLKIAVRERDPVALMVVEACPTTPGKIAEGQECEEASFLYLVSDDAKMFKRLGGRDPVDLPVITGLTRARMASDPQLAERLLADAIALMHQYRDSGLWQQNPLGEIHLEADDGLSLYVGEDLTYVRLGSAPYDAKFRRLKKVFDQLAAAHARAEYIYLDNEQRPDRVAVRLR